MLDIKTENEIKIMKEGGALLARALREVVDATRDGVTMRDLDLLAERVLREGGGEPSFKGYTTKHEKRPFPATICISRNDEIVHGPGSRNVVLHDGDVVGLDIGVRYGGFCTDMAVTVPVGKVDTQSKKLMDDTRASMLAGLDAVHAGAAVSAIGKEVEAYAKPRGYGIVRDLVGHGVGRHVHEDPHVPNYYDKRYDTVKLPIGLTIAVEPMLTLGDWRVKTLDDGWTIVTNDGSRAAHFEVTIVVTEKGFEFVTPLVI